MQNSEAPRSASDLAARAWVEVREPLDRQLSPLGLRGIEALAPRLGEAVVDIGCGTGQTVLQLAQMIGPQGSVTGVDIAPLVLEAAREAAIAYGNISFIESDATTLDLPTSSVDALFSRFGVMALARPVEAFLNFRRMLRPRGRMAFVCWRSLKENELDLLPLQAAGLEHLLDPTPFKFERPDYVHKILEASGFRNVVINGDDQEVTCGDLESTVTVLLRVGALGRILRENPELRADAELKVRAALASRRPTSPVTLRGATWVVSAEA